jgi:uncharacterized SAM-binding protein YcdF (DUF218 family)
MILKGLAALLGSPLLLALILAVSGLWLLRTLRSRLGAWLIACGLLFGYLVSTSWFGNFLLAPLERQYTALDIEQVREVHDIVVLGSSYDPRERVSIVGALDPVGLARISEGVRIVLARRDVRMFVSGGARPGGIPIARGYSDFAIAMGVSPAAITMLDHPLNTADEARDVFASLGRSPFILVTSAYHMPRAMRLMRRAGANPVPEPTGQLVGTRLSEGFGLVPGSRGLRKSETALHEYLGLAALSLGMT